MPYPGLPTTVDVNDVVQLRNALQAIIQTLNVMLGRKGLVSEQMAQWGQLNAQQIIRIAGDSFYNPNLPTEAPLQTAPVTTTNVTANGVIVTASAANVYVTF